MILPSIETPADLQRLSYEELDDLSEEIRQFIIEAVTTNPTGGHLGSNLGVVELTLALHRVFESPKDILLWDTGHQAYVHKIVTGRRIRLQEPAPARRPLGLSEPLGEPARLDRKSSHASTGALLRARTVRWRSSSARNSSVTAVQRHVVAILGDGSLTGGMAYEALNNLGHSNQRVVIVLNDNGRSYAPTISKLSESLTSLRLNKTYLTLRGRLRRTVPHLPKVGKAAYLGIDGLTSVVREMVTPHTFFENLGVRYIGPIDGHDIESIESTLKSAADWDGPILVHVLTTKGRGATSRPSTTTSRCTTTSCRHATTTRRCPRSRSPRPSPIPWSPWPVPTNGSSRSRRRCHGRTDRTAQLPETVSRTDSSMSASPNNTP